MSFDCSRFTFNPWDDYLGVVMQQGRVQLDSDWNEWLAEFARRIQAGTLDTFGRAAYPVNVTPDAFRIVAASLTNGTNQISIGPGRMYVDGLLAENHGRHATAQWDPALAEMSGSPQPPPATPTGTIDFTKQPYYPNYPNPTVIGKGTFLFYLDVWIRAVTYLEHSKLVDKAVGVDTTGRLQTVWQVKMMSVPLSTTCSNLNSGVANWPPAPSAGQLTSRLVPSAAAGPCCLTPNTGYTGMENQLYRLEIHQCGLPLSNPKLPQGTATFKWSRDNGSVATLVTAITTAGITNSAGKPATQLTVQSLGRDQVLGFAPGDWIEIVDDDLELNGQPGELHKIDGIDATARTITLVDLLKLSNFILTNGPTNPARHTRITRWDQAGQVSSVDASGNLTNYFNLDSQGQGDIPVPPPGTTLLLENGITVAFGLNPASGSFNTGDFWGFAARTADGSVEQLTQAPPLGIHHHYAPLSVVTFDGTAAPSFSDCRTPWPPACEGSCGGCCTYTVGKGGQYARIQDAIQALPDCGGQVCILPGRYFENILIRGRHDVVFQGCGWQTRIASASLQPPTGQPPANSAADALAATGTAFNAVITITDSQHVELRSFAVEAAAGDVGILIDGTGYLSSATNSNVGIMKTNYDPQAVLIDKNLGVVDTTINGLVITATTRPAILADFAQVLHIDENRIAMGNVESLWSAVYVRGIEIHLDRNWIGILDEANLREWFPTSVMDDLLSDLRRDAAAKQFPYAALAFGAVAEHPGGIQIAGPSEDVFVLENEIEGGARNGITLGNFEIIDAQKQPSYRIVGLLLENEDPCSTTGTLQTPGTDPGGSGGRVVAGGQLARIQIDRNRIRYMGLCGIGPAGYFNLAETLEVITINSLTIGSNMIVDTLQRSIAGLSGVRAVLGYGAICVPDVQNLIIRDNTITNFGQRAGANVSGIYILHGELVELSRNQVLETRDWVENDSEESTNDPRGGILVALVTPPALSSTASDVAWTKSSDLGNAIDPLVLPLYAPGLPALRVEHNVVRVPLGQALAVVGAGPFSIVNNHFGCGGTIPGGVARPIAETVVILNLGAALEDAVPVKRFADMLDADDPDFEAGNAFFSSSGAVLFTNNLCQLEKRIDTQPAFSSVAILSLDHLNFANNHCWLDLGSKSVAIDAFLFADSLHVAGNRLQEPIGLVDLSGWTVGGANITTQNITTNCLVATGLRPGMLIKRDNLALVSHGRKNDPCATFARLQIASPNT